MKKTKNKVLSMVMAATVAVSAVPAFNVLADTKAENMYTVNMNVSYQDFYRLFGVETRENVSSASYIDAVSSATKSKPYMESLNPVAYVTGDATKDQAVYIQGVKIPVQVSAKDRQDLIVAGAYAAEDFKPVSEGDKAHFEAKILDANSIVSSAAISSKAVSIASIYDKPTVLSDVEAGYTTMSKYGDYEFDLAGNDISNRIANTIPYGVIVNTKEGDQYALYSQENIWRVSSLAWSAGVVTTAHGCELRSEPYKKSEGQTVTSFTYITDKGLYIVDIPDTKLVDVSSVKEMKVIATAKELADVTDVVVTLENAPADYQAAFTYKMSGKGATEKNTLETKKNEDGTYNVKIGNLLPGTYTLVVSDSAVKYAKKSTTLNIQGSPVKVEGNVVSLNPAKGKDSISNYVSSISKVTVTAEGGEAVDYVVSKNGSGTIQVANIVNTDGIIDWNANYTRYTTSGSGKNIIYTEAGSGKVFEKGKYTVTINAKNYDTVTTDIVITDAPASNVIPSETPVISTVAPSTVPSETPVIPTVAPSVVPSETPVIPTVAPSAVPSEIPVVPSKAPVDVKSQTVKIKTGNKTIKYAKLRKKAQTFTLQAAAKTKVTFSKISGSKKISVNKNGKVTIAKGLKKGSYKVKVRAIAAQTNLYKKAIADKTIKITIK